MTKEEIKQIKLKEAIERTNIKFSKKKIVKKKIVKEHPIFALERVNSRIKRQKAREFNIKEQPHRCINSFQQYINDSLPAWGVDVSIINENLSAKGRDLRDSRREWYLADNHEPCPSVKEESDRKKEIKRIRNKKDGAVAKRRRAEDPVLKLKHGLRISVQTSFKRKGFTKHSKTFDILGCDYDTFINHIESKFTEGMTLDNHGDWHLDHQIPLALAKTEDEVRELCHYTNYQPLWAKDNLEKNANVRFENISFTNKLKYIKFLNRV